MSWAGWCSGYHALLVCGETQIWILLGTQMSLPFQRCVSKATTKWFTPFFPVFKAFMAQNLLYSAIQDQLEECGINISEELRNPFSIFSRKTHLRFQSLILSNALYNYTFLKNFTLLLTDKHPSTRVIFDWGHSLAKIWKPSELIAQHAKKSSTPNCKLANSYQHSIIWLTHHL